MKVIGLTGVARSGKDTVAGIIKDELEGWVKDGAGVWQQALVRREGFADKLKVSAAVALGYEGETPELIAFMDELKVQGHVRTYHNGARLDTPHATITGRHATITGREYLQRFGTEAHRDVFGDNFWVDAVLPWGEGEKVATGDGRLRDDCDVLVISDVRFENEAERVLDYGGQVWRITRPGVDAVNAHASEVALPRSLFTRTIPNVSGLGYLRGVVRAALRAGGFA